jgi:hypothetical protein
VESGEGEWLTLLRKAFSKSASTTFLTRNDECYIHILDSGSLPGGGRAYGTPAKALPKQLNGTAWTCDPVNPDTVAEVIRAAAYEIDIGRAREADSFARSICINLDRD